MSSTEYINPGRIFDTADCLPSFIPPFRTRLRLVPTLTGPSRVVDRAVSSPNTNLSVYREPIQKLSHLPCEFSNPLSTSLSEWILTLVFSSIPYNFHSHGSAAAAPTANHPGCSPAGRLARRACRTGSQRSQFVSCSSAGQHAHGRSASISAEEHSRE